jgi:hypothetical protein
MHAPLHAGGKMKPKETDTAEPLARHEVDEEDHDGDRQLDEGHGQLDHRHAAREARADAAHCYPESGRNNGTRLVLSVKGGEARRRRGRATGRRRAGTAGTPRACTCNDRPSFTMQLVDALPPPLLLYYY